MSRVGSHSFDCPNRKVITLAKQNSVRDEDEEEEKGKNLEEEEESPGEGVIEADDGEMLVLRQA